MPYSTHIEDAFAQACGRFHGTNFSQLDDIDKMLVTIFGLEAEVNNGGFGQYYFNAAGDQAGFAVDALQGIGDHHMAVIVSRANAVFVPDGPAPLCDVRQGQLLLRESGDTQDPWD
jgi:Domain of unknown function (DUF4375)